VNSDAWKGRPALALLAEKEEDRFTRLLRELLQHPDVLEAFLREACELQLDGTQRDCRVETQVVVPGGRADLVVIGPGIHAIFEAKVASWLHDLQMIPYVTALNQADVRDDGERVLFVVAPAASLARLRDAARSQLATKGLSQEVRGVAWQTIAATFETLSRRVRNSDLQAHLAMFADLVLCRLGDADAPFGAEELALLADPLTGRAMKRTALVYDRIVDLIKAEKGTGIGLTNASGQRWQGRTLRAGGRWWWFGIWPEVWAETGGSPLLLQLPGFSATHILPAGMTAIPLRPTVSTGAIVPLRFEPLESPTQAASRIAATVLRVVRECPATGGPNNTLPAAD